MTLCHQREWSANQCCWCVHHFSVQKRALVHPMTTSSGSWSLQNYMFPKDHVHLPTSIFLVSFRQTELTSLPRCKVAPCANRAATRLLPALAIPRIRRQRTAGSTTQCTRWSLHRPMHFTSSLACLCPHTHHRRLHHRHRWLH